MLWLYIVLSIIALLVLLLFLPVVVSLKYENDEFSARAGYIFPFKKLNGGSGKGSGGSGLIKIYNLLSGKKVPGGKKAKKGSAGSAKSTTGTGGAGSISDVIKAAVKKDGLGTAISNFGNFLLASAKGLGNFAQHIKVRRFRLNITVGGKSDPAAAAWSYGEISSALGISLGLLSELIQFKSHKINVNCNYETEKNDYNGKVLLCASPFFILTAVVKIIKDYTARRTYYARRAAARKKAAERRRRAAKKA